MSIQKKSTEMTILITPEMANFSGNMHGGWLLKYMDEVAYTCACRYCGNYVVTLAVDQVIFKNPIKIGEVVTFLASVNYTGKTSMEIGIKVIAENLQNKTVRHTNSCYFTMVSIDDGSKPSPVPPLIVKSKLEIRRKEDAERRREFRFRNGFFARKKE